MKGGGVAPLGMSGEIDGGEVRDWIALLKPRVMSLVVFTGACGLLVAPGTLHPVLAVTAILCIAIATGASGAINMWYDRDIDAVMRRTAGRPIPAGRIQPGAALSYGVFLAIASVVVMGLATNLVAATVLAMAIGFYVFIYTIWLKRRTPQNIVIGGAAGAFPPMIGWAAVTGQISVEAVLMFAIIFFWTPPHFWALSLFASGDYERAGVPMLPVVSGAKETRRQIWLYSLLLAPLGVVPTLIDMASWSYGVVATALGAWFLHAMWKVRTDAQDEAGRSLTNDAPARAGFKFSILYLFVLFATLAADILVRG
ncbi:heme o synthase [Pseudoroseomonas globiformis]|uniref:Protoheme IX farnesyltransferase n=1 Tax=Teichococcus globiformis TaxID=2307229 RepID=A0ABV7FW24_9PROT